jgi:outer membrane immunogenic protein
MRTQSIRVIAIAFVALLVLCNGTAAADDVPASARWSGFYAGVHFGYHAIDTGGVFDGPEPAGTPDLDNIGASGVHVGLRMGFQEQWKQLVLGLETDVSGGGFDKSYLTIQDGSLGGEQGLLSYPIVGDLEYLASVRGRVGFDAGVLAGHDTMFFITGGPAFTRFSMDIADRRSQVNFNSLGLVVGGGFEVAFSEKFSLGLEYLHYDFGKRRNISGEATSGVFDANDGNFVKLEDVDTMRASLNFNFK